VALNCIIAVIALVFAAHFIFAAQSGG
jgi:hypothetical protein